MEQEQRLTALPRSVEVRQAAHEYTGGYTNSYGDSVVEGKRSVQQYFNIIYKRLPLILALVILVTVAAAFYMYRQPSQYMATTEVLIEPRKPKVTSKDSININFGNDINYYNTQLELLRNPDLMKKVVVSLGLYKDKNLFDSQDRGLLAGIRSMFSRSAASTEPENTLPIYTDSSAAPDKSTGATLTPEEDNRANQYVAKLISGLRVEPRERTNLVNISISDTNPTLAARVADKVAETFKNEDEDREMRGEKQAIEDLAKSIDELKATINQQEAQLMSDMRSSNLPLQEKGQDLAAGRLGSMSDTWLKAMESRRQLEARYNAALTASSRGEGMNIPDLYENKIYQDTIRLNTERKAKLHDDIRALEKQIQELEAKKKADGTKWTDEHPEMKALIATIEEKKAIKVRTESEVSQIIERDQKKIEKDAVTGALVSLKSQLDAARKQEGQAQASYDQEAAISNIQGQAQTKMTTLKREIETNRSLLDTYTQRQKEQELSVTSGQPDNIKIAANAVVPAVPYGPQRGRNIFVAFLFSLAAGVGLAFLLDYLDDSVRTSEDIGRHLGLPTLALIPHHGISDRRRLLPAAAAANSGPVSAAMITLEERNSPMAEAYRHLRTSLLFSSAGKPPQSILVTSSQPSEGKTTTAINTAITLAQSDADVVVVDCDLRRPRVHSYFELDNTQGLTNYLSGERNTENLIKTSRDLPRLKVITSGPIPPNPAELLSSNEMKNLLQFLRGKYKHIIIDSPPAISFTDAAILATLVDGVVLVAMANKSSVHLMRRFKTRLGNLGARIYGVVLNGIKSGSIEYEYYGAGYYDYYRKSAEDTSTPVMKANGSSPTNGHQ